MTQFLLTSELSSYNVEVVLGVLYNDSELKIDSIFTAEKIFGLEED
jgi:hypothetical protein